jgi:hypothetical protein
LAALTGAAVVVRAHTIDEGDRHCAARVAEFRRLVILGQREQRQRLFQRRPGVRVELLLLRQDAGILQMGDADVVCAQREPGEIRLGDALRQPVLQIAKVACCGKDARGRIQAIDAAEPLRGFLGQLHQAAHAGLAGGLRVPLRFLVCDRGEQPPLDPSLLLRALERLAELRQCRLDALVKHAGVDARHRAVGKIALNKPLQPAVAAELREERVGAIAQRSLAGRKCPYQLLLAGDGECFVEVEIDVARRIGIVGCDNRVIQRSV